MTLRRIVALAIDWGASILVAQVIPGVSEYGSRSNSLATLAIFTFEVVILTWLMGASFGQKLIGLRIISIDGKNVKLIQAIVRTFFIILVFPPLLADKENRGLHDKIARTRLLDLKKLN
ncbi:MAG: RDD family protein [Candidatus Nanopelagicales bacterium]